VKIEVVVSDELLFWEALSSSRSRLSNDIYLTEERWNHITEPNNHPEMVDYESQVQIPFVSRQDSLNPCEVSLF